MTEPMSIPIVTTRAALRHALGQDTPGLVPTMGALHRGHLTLIEQSARENARTVVSIFVNPTQFHDQADLARYPRDLDRDVALATEAGAGLIFAPEVDQIYPPGFSTSVEVGGLTARWEGAARPGHFRGVATVVTILLNLVRPARAYFGEKDYQQLQMVKRMHTDLALPGEIVGSPTVREPDGLALSSRNARLSDAGRARAAVIPQALARMADVASETDDADSVTRAGLAVLKAEDDLTVSYLTVVDSDTLEPVSRIGPGSRALVAVVIDGIRLIDNAPLSAAPDEPGKDRHGLRD